MSVSAEPRDSRNGIHDACQWYASPTRQLRNKLAIHVDMKVMLLHNLYSSA